MGTHQEGEAGAAAEAADHPRPSVALRAGREDERGPAGDESGEEAGARAALDRPRLRLDLLAGAAERTARSRNRYLVRKTYGFDKRVPYLDDQCEVDKTFYNFCRRHRGLKGETPAKRQGITDHVWSVAEVLGYRSAAP